MPNSVDQKIDEITQEHVAECERLNVSRNVGVTAQRIQAALKSFSAVEVLGSGYWTGLHDQAKTAAIRDAVLELADKLEKLTVKPAPVVNSKPEPVVNSEPEPVASKKPARKAKVALA